MRNFPVIILPLDLPGSNWKTVLYSREKEQTTTHHISKALLHSTKKAQSIPSSYQSNDSLGNSAGSGYLVTSDPPSTILKNHKNLNSGKWSENNFLCQFDV